MLFFERLILLKEEVSRNSHYSLRECNAFIGIWSRFLPCQELEIRITFVLADFNIAVEVHLKLKNKVRVKVEFVRKLLDLLGRKLHSSRLLGYVEMSDILEEARLVVGASDQTLTQLVD